MISICNLKALLVTTGRTSESGVECYKLHDRRWYSVSDMPFKRSYVGLAVIGNKAYVIGGCYRRYAEYASVQVYDIQADQWSNGIPMTVGRSALGVAVLNDKIYAVSTKYFLLNHLLQYTSTSSVFLNCYL